MLLQRLSSAEPTVEAAIACNLVDLALTAPKSAFSDIIKAFSSINRSANLDDPRFSNNMVRCNKIVPVMSIEQYFLGISSSNPIGSGAESTISILRNISYRTSHFVC